MMPTDATRLDRLVCAEQYVEGLRAAAAAHNAARDASRRRPVRAAVGRRLVQLGERLAAPRTTAACQ
jgi:hypothetical protein